MKVPKAIRFATRIRAQALCIVKALAELLFIFLRRGLRSQCEAFVLRYRPQGSDVITYLTSLRHGTQIWQRVLSKQRAPQ